MCVNFLTRVNLWTCQVNALIWQLYILYIQQEAENGRLANQVLTPWTRDHAAYARITVLHTHSQTDRQTNINIIAIGYSTSDKCERVTPKTNVFGRTVLFMINSRKTYLPKIYLQNHPKAKPNLIFRFLFHYNNNKKLVAAKFLNLWIWNFFDIYWKLKCYRQYECDSGIRQNIQYIPRCVDGTTVGLSLLTPRPKRAALPTS